MTNRALQAVTWVGEYNLEVEDSQDTFCTVPSQPSQGVTALRKSPSITAHHADKHCRRCICVSHTHCYPAKQAHQYSSRSTSPYELQYTIKALLQPMHTGHEHIRPAHSLQLHPILYN
ncbi:TPA: hypothetical protein ACH3X1_001892 [Trebouxia sp. C0004]